MSHKQVVQLEERMKIANQQLPFGDVDTKARRSRERGTSQNKKHEFELGQKQETLNIKDKALKQAGYDIKKLKDTLVMFKKDISIYEEKNTSLQVQIKAKNDSIKRLESKVKDLANNASITIKLEQNPINNETLLTEEPMFNGNPHILTI
jgi:uncharacterized protein (UPF0335 family)